MENDWIDVSYFLYSGIIDIIKYYNSLVITTGEKISENKLRELEKAVEVYNKRCVISGKYLTEALSKLKEQQG